MDRRCQGHVSLRYHAPHCEECLPPLKIDVKCHRGQTEGDKKISRAQAVYACACVYACVCVCMRMATCTVYGMCV